MTAEVAPEPPRQVAHFALPIAAAFLLLASVLLSNRPMVLGGFNNVAVVGAVPDGVQPVYVDDWSVTIHRSDWNVPVAKALGRTGEGRGTRLGWMIREWSFLTLPLFARRRSDLLVVQEDSRMAIGCQR